LIADEGVGEDEQLSHDGDEGAFAGFPAFCDGSEACDLAMVETVIENRGFSTCDCAAQQTVKVSLIRH
jgi:hypothetical protein